MSSAFRKVRKVLLLAVLLVFIVPLAIGAFLSMLGGLLTLILLGFITFAIVKLMRVDTKKKPDKKPAAGAAGAGDNVEGGQPEVLQRMRNSKAAQRLANWIQENRSDSGPA